MKGDLHCHSIISDGSMSPKDIIYYAQKIGLEYISITDHDILFDVNSVAQNNTNIKIINGVEVSTYDYKNKKKVHLLLYNPKKTDELRKMFDYTLNNRNNASLKMLEKASEKFPLDIDIVLRYAKDSNAIYKQHIVAALMDMGYTNSIFSDLFREMFSKNGWAKVEHEYIDTREAMDILIATEGTVVLAHPGVYNNFDIIDELCEKGLDGIEVWHPRQSEKDCEKANEITNTRGLLKTGGSDFHGAYSSHINILGSRVTPENELLRLLSLLD